MASEGWNAEIYFQDGEVLMLIVEIEGIGTFFRYDGEWEPSMPDDMDLSDSEIVQIKGEDLQEVVDRYDQKDPELAQFLEDYEEDSPVTAAVQGKCPPATQDIGLNLKNRKNAIDTAMYGPLNPQEPNEEYWQALADEWEVTSDDAKKQRCGNCAVFNISTRMKDCISSGLTDNADDFDAIDAAGELGYCEAFDFKCASARTCRAWVGGGPITDDNVGEQ